MFESHFYHGTIRKYTAVVGTIFNNIKIKRSDGTEIKIPLSYGNGLQHHRKKNENNSLDGNKVGMSLPRLSFTLDSLQADALRKTNKMNQFVISDGSYQYNAIPYNFFFTVNARTKNLDDAMQIAEQIIPTFNPDINVVVSDNSDMNFKTDIKVIMTGSTPPDSYEGEIGGEQIYEWRFDITVKGYLYQQTKSGAVIKTVEISLEDAYVDKVLTDLTWAINPLSANESDPHTVDETVVE